MVGQVEPVYTSFVLCRQVPSDVDASGSDWGEGGEAVCVCDRVCVRLCVHQ